MVARNLGFLKPVTVFASDDDENRTFISSDDLYRVHRYSIDRVQSINPVLPVPVAKKITCPSCKVTIQNPEPSYLFPSCPSRCNLHPSRWKVVEQGGFRDVSTGTAIITDKLRGRQVLQFFIESFNIIANANYSKLQLAAAGGTKAVIDAIPVANYVDKGAFEFALWITRVATPDVAMTVPEQKLSFKFDKPPSSEKDAVMSMFFANIDFMRTWLGFYHYLVLKSGPDLLVRSIDGTIKVIEFEYESKNFDAHGHDPDMVDYIACWIHNREKDDVKIIDFQRFIGKEIVTRPS
jgi:hypothetical protein